YTADRLELDRAFVLKLIAIELHGEVGTVERGPGLGIGAFQKHTFGIGLAGDGSGNRAQFKRDDDAEVLEKRLIRRGFVISGVEDDGE
ncbi:MAG: hypothetical protein COW74_00230, partial [Piscirickettsiaceae bacterium CG18_big_fil_WC_8_21_14_2_50_44_103]